MISVFSHRNLNIHLSHNLRYRIPYGLRSVFIILCSICFDHFTVYSYAFDCVTNLVLYTEYKSFALFYTARAVYDSCAVLRIDGVSYLITWNILHSS